ncbi:MAG TPA: efflux RND transporter periplasmic adaptor subunit [Gemmatimonadaceae bacterium]|nr:efflux RND transporter periplasmic adaptor subunit [Gemmatimonadaceae bacterium]
MKLRSLVPLLPILCLACARDRGATVKGTGTLEVVEVDIAPMTPARVVKVWRQEGDTVHVGDTLVSLTQSTVHADIDARRARVASAEAQLRDLEAGARPAEINKAEAELRAYESEANRAAQDYSRVQALAASGTVSTQQLDAAKSASQLAAAQRDGARDALRLLREGARPERVAAARAEVANARAALVAAQQTASDLVLVTPVGGTVMLRNAEPGEVIGPGQAAMTVGELSRPYVRIYVNQRLIPHVRLHARAEGILDGLPDQPFVGEVEAINSKAEFTPRVALTDEERADLLFGVKVAFRDTTGALKPGLPITVRIATTPSTAQASRP